MLIWAQVWPDFRPCICRKGVRSFSIDVVLRSKKKYRLGGKLVDVEGANDDKAGRGYAVEQTKSSNSASPGIHTRL
jgi:hypothetical protein